MSTSEEGGSDRRGPFARSIARNPGIFALVIIILLGGLAMLFMFLVSRFITSTFPPNRIRVDVAEIQGTWYIAQSSDMGENKKVTVTDRDGGEMGVVINNGTSQDSYDVFINENGTLSAAKIKLLWQNWTVVHKTSTCIAITGTATDWYMIWHRSSSAPDADITAAQDDLTAIGVTL